MFVRIKKANKGAWYENMIGKKFEVEDELQTVIDSKGKHYKVYMLKNDNIHGITPFHCNTVVQDRKNKLKRILNANRSNS
jgi:hypothetical protein